MDISDENDTLTDYFKVDKLTENGDIQSAKHYSGNGRLLNTLDFRYEGRTKVSERFMIRDGGTTETFDYVINKNKWRTRKIYTSSSMEPDVRKKLYTLTVLSGRSAERAGCTRMGLFLFAHNG